MEENKTLMKVDISLESGKFLINGKKYKDLSWEERKFFDEFLVAVKLDISTQNHVFN